MFAPVPVLSGYTVSVAALKFITEPSSMKLIITDMMNECLAEAHKTFIDYDTQSRKIYSKFSISNIHYLQGSNTSEVSYLFFLCAKIKSKNETRSLDNPTFL